MPQIRPLPVLLVFSLMPCIGTLVHEAGHILVARALGHETQLSYASMIHWPADGGEDPLANVLVSAGGPSTNMGVGTVGLALLWARRRRGPSAPRTRLDWTAFVLALFWSRQPFNALGGWILGSETYGDEGRIAQHFDLPVASLSMISGGIGALACIAALAYFARTREWSSLLIPALTGIVIGWFAWMRWLGPSLLP